MLLSFLFLVFCPSFHFQHTRHTVLMVFMRRASKKKTKNPQHTVAKRFCITIWPHCVINWILCCNRVNNEAYFKTDAKGVMFQSRNFQIDWKLWIQYSYISGQRKHNIFIHFFLIRPPLQVSGAWGVTSPQSTCTIASKQWLCAM